LLVGAAALYIPARLYEAVHPAVGYLRAFAEAAMVGALADWFAVTALFRRPMGLPIPHTAVVPHNKDRIGEALGKFIERNFLTAEAIRFKLASIDFAALFALWLKEPANRDVVAEHVTAMLPHVLDATEDEEVGRFIHQTLSEHMKSRLEVMPLIAEFLGMLTAANRHQLLIDELLRQAAALLKESEPLIREKVSSSTAWLWRKLSIDERISNQIMSAAETVLLELSEDHGQPWRQHFDRTVQDFIQNLRTSGDYQEQGELLKARLLENPAIGAYLGRLWADLKDDLRQAAGQPESGLRRRLSEGLEWLADGLLKDDVLRARLNGWLQQVILDVIDTRRHEISRLVTDTVRSWDPDTMAGKIEQEIGDDLQYIRINGTLVGGLAGVLIHALSQLFI
ncbi:MAG: DUF445 domain-containing protein, partial [Zoogloea sp.]|nr:DUF445 domain-containing protein [Zoogloea sp.]